jgi:hypothetical protein
MRSLSNDGKHAYRLRSRFSERDDSDGVLQSGPSALIPGGAGVAVSSASTAETVRSTLVEKTSAQIAESVMAGLLKDRVPRASAERLVHNRVYTPADLLILSKSLASLKAQNTALFVARAAGAATREEAMFQRRRAELLASNAKLLGIGPFVDVAGFPLNRLKDGRLLALFPLDEVAWTEGVAAASPGLPTQHQAKPLRPCWR